MLGCVASSNSLPRVSHLASPVREQVADIIRDQIINGTMREGQRLIERELCEQLDISRNTLREAYRQLEAEGFVELKPHKGPAVSRITPREARGLYELREALEGLAIRLFTQRATDSQIRELRSVFSKLKAAHRSADVVDMLHCKNELYDVLYAGADNEILRAQAKVLQGRLTQLRSRSLSEPGRPKTSISEMTEVMRKISIRDAAGAEAAWCEHIRSAYRVMAQVNSDSSST